MDNPRNKNSMKFHLHHLTWAFFHLIHEPSFLQMVNVPTEKRTYQKKINNKTTQGIQQHSLELLNQRASSKFYQFARIIQQHFLNQSKPLHAERPWLATRQ